MAHLYKNTCMSDRREGSVEAAIAVDFVFRLKDNFKPLPNKPWSLRVCHTSLLKTLWEKEKLLVTSNLSFPTVFSTCLKSFLSNSTNLKLLSANSLSLEESKICRLGKG